MIRLCWDAQAAVFLHPLGFMTSSSTTDRTPIGKVPSPLAATSLKLVGGIAILLFLIDFATVLFPPQFDNTAWQLNATTQLLDRGIIALVGIGLLFTGYWIDSSLGNAPRRSNLSTDIRFWTCLLSAFLGLVFLITTFLHPNLVVIQRRDALKRLDTEATELTAQMEGRLNEEISAKRAQANALLNNDEAFQAAVASGNLDDGTKAQIEQFRKDPEAFNKYWASQVAEAQNRIKTGVGENQQDKTSQIKTEAVKALIRGILSSVLLTIGFVFIGWSGLRRLFAMVN